MARFPGNPVIQEERRKRRFTGTPVEQGPEPTVGTQFGQGLRQGTADLVGLASRASPLAGVPPVRDISPEAVESLETSVAGRQTEPENFSQRLSRALGEFLPGTLVTGGPMVAGSRQGVRALIGEAGAFGGGATGKATAETLAPGSPTAQIVGTVFGSLSPSAMTAATSAATKGLIRGSREGMEESVQTFERVGATPSAGQASPGGDRADFLEQVLGKIPGSQGKIARFGGEQQQAVGQTVGRQAERLSPRASPEVAGRTIEKGLTGRGGFLERFNTRAEQEFSRLNRSIPNDQVVTVSNARNTLDNLAGESSELGAVERVLSNERVSQLRQALDEVAPEGQISFQALQRFRSLVGRKLASASLVEDIPTGQLKQLYGSLSDDLREAARRAGPQAVRQFERANRHYRAGLDRIESIVEKVSKKATPEDIFRFATQGTREGGTRIRQVMRSLQPEERKVIAASMVRRLGRANPSKQDELGEVFSTERFLTNWNSMSPEAKRALFNGTEMGALRESLDDVASVAARIRESSEVLSNPSGTAQAGSNILTLGAIGSSGGLLAAGQENAALVVPLVVGGLVTGARGAAQLMTSPGFVRWLAKGSKMRPGQIPGHVARLGQVLESEGPEVREAAAGYVNALQEMTGLAATQAQQRQEPTLRPETEVGGMVGLPQRPRPQGQTQ